MFQVDLSLFVAIGVYTGIAFIVLLWVYYDRVGKTIHQEKRDRVIFHCVRCGHLYTDRKGVEDAVCPRCGMDNIKLRF